MKLVTHDEEFHTDDVFGTALMLSLYPDAELVRSRDPAVIAAGDIVYDVGKVYDPLKHRFDHHQLGAAKRPNGITYCGFGLLWQEYGLEYCDGDQELCDAIDQRLVMPIDAIDNGQTLTTALYEGAEPFTVDTIVTMLNPLSDDIENYDEQFRVAVELAGRILGRVRDSLRVKLHEKREFLRLYADVPDKQVVVIEKRVDVNSFVDACPELKYVISPRPDGKGWGILAVSEVVGSFTPRLAFPEAWRAKSPEELAQLTGVSDATFCHATGFLAVADSRESAERLARLSLELARG